MNATRLTQRTALATTFLTLTLTLVASSVFSADRRVASQAQQRYQQERAVCLSGQSHQDRATCLTEANNAYAEARRGGLSVGNNTDLQANALARCDAQPPADRQACVLRIQGEGSVDGSVKSGGVIRQIELPVR